MAIVIHIYTYVSRLCTSILRVNQHKRVVVSALFVVLLPGFSLAAPEKKSRAVDTALPSAYTARVTGILKNSLQPRRAPSQQSAVAVTIEQLRDLVGLQDEVARTTAVDTRTLAQTPFAQRPQPNVPPRGVDLADRVAELDAQIQSLQASALTSTSALAAFEDLNRQLRTLLSL